MTLSVEDIRATAHITLSILSSANFVSCLVGSSACHGHGASRIPNDIDIMVLNASASSDEIKVLIVSMNPRFSLHSPRKNPQADYQVLWYEIAPQYQDRANIQCRIDILHPGIIQLPSFTVECIYHPCTGALVGLPIMPFEAALLHKVLAWKAHKEMTKNLEIENDVSDIAEMLPLAATSTFRSPGPNESHIVQFARCSEWLPPTFLDSAISTIPVYVQQYPETAELWKQILANWELN